MEPSELLAHLVRALERANIPHLVTGSTATIAYGEPRSASTISSTSSILVHAKNDDAKRFYERFDFEPLPANTHHLVMLMKDLKRIVELPADWPDGTEVEVCPLAPLELPRAARPAVIRPREIQDFATLPKRHGTPHLLRQQMQAIDDDVAVGVGVVDTDGRSFVQWERSQADESAVEGRGEPLIDVDGGFAVDVRDRDRDVGRSVAIRHVGQADFETPGDSRVELQPGIPFVLCCCRASNRRPGTCPRTSIRPKLPSQPRPDRPEKCRADPDAGHRAAGQSVRFFAESLVVRPAVPGTNGSRKRPSGERTRNGHGPW